MHLRVSLHDRGESIKQWVHTFDLHNEIVKILSIDRACTNGCPIAWGDRVWRGASTKSVTWTTRYTCRGQVGQGIIRGGGGQVYWAQVLS